MCFFVAEDVVIPSSPAAAEEAPEEALAAAGADKTEPTPQREAHKKHDKSKTGNIVDFGTPLDVVHLTKCYFWHFT